MKLWMLGSGSSGNLVLVECRGERIVIDIGFGPRTTASRLKQANAPPESVSACFLTHEHSDHTSGARKAAKKWDWKLFASRGTLSGPELRGLAATEVVTGEPVTLTRMIVEPVPTSHDARESMGYVVTERESGARAAIFYDLGRVSPDVARACSYVDILVIEANHDDEMLRSGPYPPWLQARIRASTGHLSNAAAASLAARSVSKTLSHVVLAHLSEKCNTPAVALRAVGDSLRRTRFMPRLTASPQDGVVGPFEPRGTRRARPLQMELSLG